MRKQDMWTLLTLTWAHAALPEIVVKNDMWWAARVVPAGGGKSCFSNISSVVSAVSVCMFG